METNDTPEVLFGHDRQQDDDDNNLFQYVTVHFSMLQCIPSCYSVFLHVTV